MGTASSPGNNPLPLRVPGEEVGGMFRDAGSAAPASHSGGKKNKINPSPLCSSRHCTMTCKSHVFPGRCGSGNVKAIFMSLLSRSPRHGIFYFLPFISLKQPVSENLRGQIIKRATTGFGRSPSSSEQPKDAGLGGLLFCDGHFDFLHLQISILSAGPRRLSPSPKYIAAKENHARQHLGTAP